MFDCQGIENMIESEEKLKTQDFLCLFQEKIQEQRSNNEDRRNVLWPVTRNGLI